MANKGHNTWDFVPTIYTLAKGQVGPQNVLLDIPSITLVVLKAFEKLNVKKFKIHRVFNC